MTHEELIRNLDPYIDGELSDAARRDVEDHLAACASCREELKRMGSLLDHAAILRDRPVTPARDLWPDVRRSLNPAPPRLLRVRRFWNLRLEWFPGLRWAAVAMALAAVIWVVGNLLPGAGPHDLAELGPDSQPGGQTELAAVLSAMDAEYGASLNLLVQAVEAAPEASREAGWAVFEENLGVLDTAITESRRALEEDPANTDLQWTLMITYQKQLDLLRWAQRVIGQA